MYFERNFKMTFVSNLLFLASVLSAVVGIDGISSQDDFDRRKFFKISAAQSLFDKKPTSANKVPYPFNKYEQNYHQAGEIDLGYFPYLATIYKPADWNANFYVLCGGSIISRWHILTAASCLSGNAKAESHSVRVNTIQLLEGGELIQVQEIVPHPFFNNDTNENDICVLKLKNRITSPEVGFVTLPPPGAALSGINTLTSFGYTLDIDENTGGEYLSSSTTVDYLDVPVIDREQCRRDYGVKIPDNTFCPGYYGKDSLAAEYAEQDFGNPDGGPLVLWDPNSCSGHYQLGIVSHLKNAVCVKLGDDTNKEYLQVFTKVSSYFEWILHVMQN